MHDGPEKRWLIRRDEGAWLLIDKPAGMTSFDVVHQVRRITGERRVGHAGTLDPMATGLLLIATRKATRELDAELHGNKRYEARIRFGLVSPTWDTDAPWLHEVEVPAFTEERIGAELEKLGRVSRQVPPMMVAIKRFGQRLYKLARKGWWLEREEREVRIEELKLLRLDEESGILDIEIACGGGLYVRSLVRDLGASLGVPAAMTALRRTGEGKYSVTDAIGLGILKEYWAQ